MRSIILLAGTAALLAGAQTVSAQRPPVAVEVRGAFALPSGGWNRDEVFENGRGVGATLTFMVAPRMGVYAGWERVQFPADEELLVVGGRADVTDAGFRAGLASFVPIAALPAATPFTELGVIYNTFTLSSSDGSNSNEVEAERALGYEAGVGVVIHVAPPLAVTPILRYREYELEFGDSARGADKMQYFSLGVGLRLRM